MKCKLALIKFDSGVNSEEIYKKNFYSYQFLKKYFLIDNEMYTVRNNLDIALTKTVVHI